MRNKIHHLCFLVLLCASDGWSQNTDFPLTESTTFPTTDVGVTFSSTTAPIKCIHREGTSFSVLLDVPFPLWDYFYSYRKVLDHLSARFPCVTRQYTSIILHYAETHEISADADEFLDSLITNDQYYSDYYEHVQHCNQSLLYGLKRALEISPAESVMCVFTSGSMTDYNDTQLLSDVYTLLKQKKSQVLFLLRKGLCNINSAQQQILKDISFLSYGEIINFQYVDIGQLVHSLTLLLSKPLNHTNKIHTLDIKQNTTDKYTEVFHLSTSFTHLLITGDFRFPLNLTDPSGNILEFKKTPIFYSYVNDLFYCGPFLNSDFCYDLHAISSYLVKNPASGTWTISALGNKAYYALILGFSEMDQSGNCSDLACHPNATCEEFGGYGECTCKEGFAGDGFVCDDIDECQYYYTSNCYWYGYGSCINTIGSYTCNCSGGYTYEKQFGCVDIDECADSALNNCHPLAVCTNNFGSYTCTCPYGYYGDGSYCEVNECQQGTPCNSSEECIKYNGSYSCMDPCSNNTVLNDPWRSTSHRYGDKYYCDNGLQGWYRFKGEYDLQIPEQCPPPGSCGTNYPMWLNRSHPAVSDGIVNRTICGGYHEICCLYFFEISLKKCLGGFYVYKLQRAPACNLAYCTESVSKCSEIVCAPDEECRINGGIAECYCKDSSIINYGSQALTGYLQPQVICGLDNIQVTFGKCFLEKLSFNTSSIHLRDVTCRGVIVRRDKSYITLTTRPRNGNCGGETWNEGSDIKYRNTVYLAFKSDGVIIRNEQPINFYCSYPLNMEINLLSAINPLTVTVPINVNGTANYTITMGLFQDSSYTNPFTGSEVRINSNAMLYVGVMASGGTSSSPFVLIMKNCYATPTADTNGTRYDIIKDRCPKINDPTISMPENGVSLKGRFSIQMFKFVASSQVYLHCQVGLCDPSNSDCSTHCSLSRTSTIVDSTQIITIGPIRNTDAAPSLSSGTGPFAPTAELFIPAIVFLVLLFQRGC